jgi:SCY1-like protein 2
MFSTAFKSFTSNITANYDISKQSTATAGPWTIFDAKKKSTGAQTSVFVFKREALDVGSGGFGARASATSIRKVQDEVVDRLKKEASSLARLRHPSILQLVEPVEETRSGGLMFATEPVLASLAGALAQKDRRQSSDSRTRPEREEGPSHALKDVDLDELEIQKGLLQVAKGLEFLHDQAKQVHGNLNPDAIFINAKSDWKISGLAYAGPPDGAEGHQPVPQISLSEVLHHDLRIPRFVQLNLDYTSPDFVLDSNVNFSADIFSLGLVLLACYRRPHTSPIETHGSQSTYKKICNSAATVPNPGNNYLCSNNLPRELAQTLPRVLARRPAQRMSASEFQQSQYFDNILVNTMRFLDALPAKSPAEKSQFMRGLGRVMPQFPPSILGKKVLSALLDELKDRDLLALILQNIFHIIKTIPESKVAVSDKVLPSMKDIFLSKSKSEERDTSKEAGLVIVLENLQLISRNCTAKQFKEDALPIVHFAMESSTHVLTDAALQTLPVILPLIDFSTVKHDLFPVVASVFAKTSSLSIKVRGLEALGTLCGAQGLGRSKRADDLSGSLEAEAPDKSVSSLDKFTMQEKVVPLLKGIKTKEPTVMMAALKVFRQVGQAADIEFLAMEVMPILWSFALGPLLDMTQFKSYMDLIKSLSTKIEREQTRKLQELGSTRASESRNASQSLAAVSNGTGRLGESIWPQDDFEKLVHGNKNEIKHDPFAGAMTDGQRLTQNPPSFSWSNSAGGASQPQRSSTPMVTLQPQAPSRSITPDVSMAAFPSLQPASSSSASIWGPTSPTANALPLSRPAQTSTHSSTFPTLALQQAPNAWQQQQSSSFSAATGMSSPTMIAPPPSNTTSMTPWQQSTHASGRIANATGTSKEISHPQPTLPGTTSQSQTQQLPRSGLDKYQSLL